MRKGANRNLWNLYIVIFLAVGLVLVSGCSHRYVSETEYTAEGNKSLERESVDDRVYEELRRVFENTRLEATGIFEHENESLARKGAITLAVENLAGQVETKVQSNTVIYNREDIRDMVRTEVNALVRNYRIDQEGYEPPSSHKYRVKISIAGEQLIREIRMRIRVP